MVMIITILFILGLVIGSFINALEYRTEKEIGLKGRSFCPTCKHKLAWYDLIPVVSWLFLRGRCRYCNKAISKQYPLVELTTGAVFAGVGVASGSAAQVNGYLLNGVTPKQILLTVFSLFLLLFISFCLILIGLYDLKTTYILSKYVYFALIAAGLLLAINCHGSLVIYLAPYLLSALIPAGFFGALYLVSKGKWLGAGDIELALLMGMFLGWPKIVVAYYFACIVGSIFGLGKIYLTKKARFNSEIPFAPFLVAGTFFAFVFGQQLFDIYVRIVLGG